MNTNSKLLIVLIILIAILTLFIIFIPYQPLKAPVSTAPSSPQACTEEAKLCPDGSYVGRTGPDCQFAACPVSSVPANWQTYSSDQSGLSFKYPENLGTTYVGLVDWPPQVQVLDKPVTCTEAGNLSQPAGLTKQETINGHLYCVTEEDQGAAGSTYRQYAFASVINGQEVVFTFSLQYPQCANYPEPKGSVCQHEESSVDIGSVVDQMFGTLTSQ